MKQWIEVARTFANHRDDVADDWFARNMHLIPDTHRSIDRQGVIRFQDVMIRALGHESDTPGEFALVYYGEDGEGIDGEPGDQRPDPGIEAGADRAELHAHGSLS